jgi:hypothetical protein
MKVLHASLPLVFIIIFTRDTLAETENALPSASIHAQKTRPEEVQLTDSNSPWQPAEKKEEQLPKRPFKIAIPFFQMIFTPFSAVGIEMEYNIQPKLALGGRYLEERGLGFFNDKIVYIKYLFSEAPHSWHVEGGYGTFKQIVEVCNNETFQGSSPILGGGYDWHFRKGFYAGVNYWITLDPIRQKKIRTHEVEPPCRDPGFIDVFPLTFKIGWSF